MELALSFSLDTSSLMGFPTEYAPRLAVWTTDATQRMTVEPGKAVDLVETKLRAGSAVADSVRPVVFSALGNAGSGKGSPRGAGAASFPVNDPMADVCIALYVRSRFNGGSDRPVPEAVDAEPYTICLGQINLAWHVILRFMVGDGHAALARGAAGAAALEAGAPFPRTTLEQEVSSLVTREGVAYRIELLKNSGSGKDKRLALELEAMDPADLAHKASITVHAGLLRARDSGGEGDTRDARLALTERFLLDNRPRGSEHAHASASFVAAVQAYDVESNRRDELYRTAMSRYSRAYDALWTMSGRARVLTLPNARAADGPGATEFRPDVPSMARFHLPLWINGEEKYPFAEWQLSTLPGRARHLPEPTVRTEAWLRTLIAIATRRAGTTAERFARALEPVTRGARHATPEYLARAALIGTPEHDELIRAVEVAGYVTASVAHNGRYQGDGRYVNGRLRSIRKFLRMRLDVESPSHDVMAGTAADGDCEDLEKLIAILTALIELGRIGGSQDGRGWTDAALVCLRDLLVLCATFHTFGSVNGAELKDAAGKENEEGLVGSKADMGDDIGGHMFGVTATLPHLEARYIRSRDLILRVTGEDLPAVLTAYIDSVMGDWVGGDRKALARLRRVWATLPARVNEGTGRQEPLLLPAEHYFGISEELLRRAAMHAAELDVLHQWPKEPRVLALPRSEDEDAPAPRSSDDGDALGRTIARILKGEERSAAREPPLAATETRVVSSLGEALPYSFQRRLLAEAGRFTDPSSGRSYERHRSPFYRRLGHASCEKLARLHPAFGHLIWVSTKTMTYGAVLGHFLDPAGDALPLPLPGALRDCYMGTLELQDLVAHRMRRVIPYDLSFAHLAHGPDVHSAHPLGAGAGAPAVPQQPFFAQSRCTWEHTPAVLSSGHAGAKKHSKACARFVIYVAADGVIARCIKALTGSSAAVWKCAPEGRITVRYRDEAQVALLRDFLAARPGVQRVEIVHERVLPWLPDMLCLYFTRRVAFVIDDARAAAAAKRDEEEQAARKKAQEQALRENAPSHARLSSSAPAPRAGDSSGTDSGSESDSDSAGPPARVQRVPVPWAAMRPAPGDMSWLQ